MIRLRQTCFDLPPFENRIVNLVKAKYDLNSKPDAILWIIKKYAEEILEEKYMPENDSKEETNKELDS